VASQDIPLSVTMDLVSHNSTQTPFVLPGYEDVILLLFVIVGC